MHARNIFFAIALANVAKKYIDEHIIGFSNNNFYLEKTIALPFF